MDGDYEQYLGMAESGKEFKERRRNEKSYMDNLLTRLKKLPGKKNGYG